MWKVQSYLLIQFSETERERKKKWWEDDDSVRLTLRWAPRFFSHPWRMDAQVDSELSELLPSVCKPGSH